MSEALKHTMIYEVLFPSLVIDSNALAEEALTLQKVIRFIPSQHQDIRDLPWVIFDFECTGLDQNEDRIVEIGAIRLSNFEPVAEFSTLIDPEIRMSDASMMITGISNEMVAGQPKAAEVIPQFLEFMEGCLLVAHNADFDLGFLTKAAARLGYQLDWPALCTLKMARSLLPDLESKSLDFLAQHFNLEFEARHRSIGDVKVTCAVLRELLNLTDPPAHRWQEFLPFVVQGKG